MDMPRMQNDKTPENEKSKQKITVLFPLPPTHALRGSVMDICGVGVLYIILLNIVCFFLFTQARPKLLFLFVVCSLFVCFQNMNPNSHQMQYAQDAPATGFYVPVPPVLSQVYPQAPPFLMQEIGSYPVHPPANALPLQTGSYASAEPTRLQAESYAGPSSLPQPLHAHTSDHLSQQHFPTYAHP